MAQHRNSIDRLEPPPVNILLVDDKRANLLALAEILDDLGHNLVKALSGEDALERLGNHDFALVLLDVQMPGMDGFETASRIRALDRSHHTPIIFLSAFDSDRLTVEQAYALGAVDYLVKPLVPIIVRAKVAGFVELFQKSEQIRRMERRQFDDKLAEENARLRESERQKEQSLALLNTLQNNAPVGFAFVDREFRYVRINDAMAAMNGMTPADHLGHTVQESVPGLWKQIQPLLRGVLDSGLPVTNQEVAGERPAAPGNLCHWLVNYYPVHIDGEIAGIGILVTDITERKRLEDELRRRAELLHESEQRFARFMQHLPGLAWAKDLQGRYVYVNDAAEKAFRMPRLHLYGKTDEEIFPPETARQFRDNDRSACASGTGVQVIETLQHDDGTLHHSIVSKFPILGIDGKPALVGGMAIDITDRMRAEETLREADRRKDEFLATLAHELRNPLAPIANAVELLRHADGQPALAEEARCLMERQLRHMVRLIDDLLDISRIASNKVHLRKERISLESIFHTAVEAARPLIEARGHHLTVNAPAPAIILDADPVRLAQVISNLLNNAAKYTERGGHIWLAAERQQDQGVISVRDTGIGIAGEHLPYIFKMFSQAAPALERSQGGLGIGLSLVRGLVELHGGTVEARSGGIGLGSEFVVRLPAMDGPACAESKPLGPCIANGRGRRILAVDDNRDAADSLAMMLRMMGHDVNTAYDGLEAIQAAATLRPEVILLDIGLPKMNGYEVARHIRQQPWGKDLAIVALTGWGQQEDKNRAAEAGCDRHLTKPVEAAALEKAISAART